MKNELSVIPGLKNVRFMPGEFIVTPETRIGYSAAIKASTISIFEKMLGQKIGAECKSKTISDKDRYLKVVIRQGKSEIAFDESFLKNIRNKNEGYLIEIRPGEIVIAAFDQPGIFYGLVTFLRLVEEKKVIRCCRITDFPSLKIRGIHFDLKSSFPTVKYLKSTIKTLAFYKINTILIEYEDKIKYDKHPSIGHPGALSKEEWKKISQFAKDHFISVIPLQQCLGHVEYILKKEKYRPLAENGHIQQLCPSRPGSRKIIEDLIEEILEIHPESRYFHIGGDEAYYLGECPECRKKDKDKLYLAWILGIVSFLKERGKTVIIWDDMLRKMRSGLQKNMQNRVSLMYWGYGPSPAKTNGAYFEKSREYAQNGFPVIAGAGAKGVTGFFSNLGHFENNAENIRQWTADAVKFGFEGVISTTWSAWSSLLPPCEIFETGWHAFLFSAECFWTGGINSKDNFNRRFVNSFLGINDPKIVSAVFSLNNMPQSREYAVSSSKAKAESYLESSLKKVGSNQLYLKTLLLFSWVESHIWDRGRLFEELFESHRYLADKNLTDNYKEIRLGWINEMKQSADELAKELRKLLKPMVIESDIEKLIDARFYFEEKELDRFLRLFTSNKSHP